jgi:predicted DsbA family dithiol-disulfide isomerase
MEIEVWSDYACPWCALGLYRLDRAREQFEHGDQVRVTQRAFELDPHAPPRRPQTMEQVLAAKYGMSPDQVRAGHAQLAAFGREVGMNFAFERIQLGNTFDAHRLASSARGTAHEDALVKGLFAAYFTEGRLLSDPEVLVEVAAAAGLDAGSARAVVESDAFVAEVRADEAAARAADVSGVPHFLINGKWAVPGAQDVETLVILLGRAWERTEVPAP